MRYVFTLLLSFCVVMGANAQVQKQAPKKNQNTANNQIGLATKNYVNVQTSTKDPKEVIELQLPHSDPNPPTSYYNVPKSKNDVTIGNGTLDDYGYPINAFWGFSYTQSIYLASEIGFPGNITKIKYYFNGDSLSNSDQWVVYMGHTTKSTIASGTDWVPVANLTEVYNGTITWAANSWVEITLTTPFNYNGTDNLVIAVDENKPQYNGSSDKFYCSSVNGNRSMLYRSDSNNPDPTNPPTASLVEAVIPNIVISITPNITNTHDLLVSAINVPDVISPSTSFPPSTTISNFGSSNEDTFDVYFRIFDDTGDTVYADTVQNPDTINSLQSLNVSFDSTTLTEGFYTCQAVVSLTGDEDNTNDTLEKSIVVANSVNMQNGSSTTCLTLFYDSGGPNANYQNGENLTYTFLPGSPNKAIKVEFKSFETENNFDSLMIYNSNNTNSGYIGKFMGTISPGTIIAQNLTGALTFKFKSDDYVNRTGWYAIVSCVDQLANDLAVIKIEPNFVFLGNTVKPKVTIFNKGTSAQSTWTVTITDGGAYTSTKSDLATISPFGSYVVEMDDWTPAQGNHTLTATVTLTGDQDSTNNQMNISVLVDNYDNNSYTLNATAKTYNTINLTDGTTTGLTTNETTTPFPMAEEFNGNSIYRIYNDLTIGTVSPIGQYTQLGTLTGFSGTPTSLAYDFVDSQMYAIIVDASNKSQLCSVNLNTFQLTPIGSPANPLIIGADFADDGFIYGPSISDDTLYKINPQTGAFTAIGPVGINLNYGQDVSYDFIEEKLYTITCGATVATHNKFGYYNLTTGAFTEIADKGTDQYATFVITKPPVPKYLITFHVTDGTNDIENAKITINGFELFTDSNGIASKKYKDGTYSYTVEKYGYQTDSGTFTVAGQNLTVEDTLTALPTYTATITIKNTLSAPIVGANVVVKFGTTTITSGQTNDSGIFVATGIIAGAYSVQVNANGFEPDTIPFTVVDTDVTVPVVLTEVIWTPYGLLAQQLNNEHDVLFSWNNDLGFTDDFESYTDFEYQHIGDYTLYDGDGVESYGFQNYNFPNEGYTGSYIIFNPALCTPPLSDTNAQPHSGSKYIACFNATASPWNNDWLITKQVTVANGMKFSFWASTYQIYQVGEQFKVGVSTTNTAPNSFTFISPLVTVPIGWTYYEYDLSTYAGQNVYLAINCLSQDEFIFMIDDLAVGMGKKSPKPVVSYTVSLNDSVVATGITQTQYTFQDLTAGDYTFGVKGVFQTGASNYALLNFRVTGTEELGSKTIIYPNPTSDFVNIQAKGNYNIKLLDVNGRVVLNQKANNNSTLDLRNLPNGVYMLQMTFDKDQTTTRIIKK